MVLAGLSLLVELEAPVWVGEPLFSSAFGVLLAGVETDCVGTAAAVDLVVAYWETELQKMSRWPASRSGERRQS